MPLVKVEVSKALSQNEKVQLLGSVSKLISEATGKQEQYIMVTYVESTIIMGRDESPAVCVDVRSIGALTSGVVKMISEKLCELMRMDLDILGERVYINFTSYTPGMWGWNGGTF